MQNSNRILLIKVILFTGGFLFWLLLVSAFSEKSMRPIDPVHLNIFIENLSVWDILPGLIFGILFIFLEKGFIVLYTSAVGAYFISGNFETDPLVFYALLAAGASFQFWISRNSRVRNMELEI